MSSLWILSLVCIIGCSSMMLNELPEEKRVTVKIIESKFSKIELFESASSFLAKHIKDSNHAFKIRDKDSGKIIAKVSTECFGLKRPDVITSIDSTPVNITADLSFKDKKVRVEVVMTSFWKSGIYGTSAEMFIAEDKGQDVIVKMCNEKFINLLEEQLLKSSVNW